MCVCVCVDSETVCVFREAFSSLGGKLEKDSIKELACGDRYSCFSLCSGGWGVIDVHVQSVPSC